MKPEIVILIIIYWVIIGIITASNLASPINSQNGFNTSNINITSNTTTATGIPAVDILQLLSIVFLGLGLPATVPLWFAVCFTIWQWLIGICFVIGLIS